MRLVLAGTLLGLAGSLATARFLGALLVGVEPADPTTLAAAALAMALVTFVACYLPARRASSVDPQVALSTD
jgi:ABC-type antimicrobial peptide transport system permease subunit